MELRSGTEIKNYRLIQRLGSGASGEVWEAQELVYRSTASERDSERPTEPQRFAVKFMNERLLSGAEADLHRFRLTTELRALERLAKVPRIPQLIDYDLNFARPYLVMELVRGPAWDTLIESGEMFYIPVSRRLDLLQQVAETLTAIHGHGFVHRDIKPANIHGIETPTILDFSIAYKLLVRADDDPVRAREEALAVETDVGTAIYMPPLKDPIDALADNYAFALVAYEVLFGQHAIFTPDMIGPTVEDTRMIAQDRIERHVWHLPTRIAPEGVPLDLKGADMALLDAIFEKAIGKYDTRYDYLDTFINDLRTAILIPQNEEYLEQHAAMSPPTPRYLIPQEKRYTVNEVQRAGRITDHGKAHNLRRTAALHVRRPSQRSAMMSLWIVVMLLGVALFALILALSAAQ